MNYNKSLVIVILDSHDLLQNSGIAQLSTCIKLKIYSNQQSEYLILTNSRHIK